MSGEIIRRLPQREVESVDRDVPSTEQSELANAGVHAAGIHSTSRDKKDGYRRSPSLLVRLVFTAMCVFTAHFAAKMMQLRSASSDAEVSKYTPERSKTSIRSRTKYSISFDVELELQSLLNQPVVLCHTPMNAKSYEEGILCPEQKNTNDQILIYNPSNHDKFICNGKIILGPKKVRFLDTDNLEECWKRPIETLLMSHSFPIPPTYENRGEFPGIVVESTASTKNGYDDTFSTEFVSQRTLLSSRDPSNPECDVNCSFETLTGINQHRYIYGTDWHFIMSMEGEEYYPELKIDTGAWKGNKFYATTSFQSEVPLPYFSFAEYNIQNSAVSFKDAIRGASFLAKNCNSLNNREDLVHKLMGTEFRVDSLSSCLNNVDDPGFDLSNKGEVMSKYMFHLAFENQNTNDYITEKLWGSLSSGTIPVYFGAPNAKRHVPFKGVIFVDDFPSIEALADYLIKVSNDQSLYESYHSWRKEPLPDAFLAKYNISHTHSKCRTCRWAHAKKYGLSWNHTSQTIEPGSLSRAACVQNVQLTTPVSESWHALDNDNELKLIKLERSGSSCPLKNGVSRARVDNGELTRSVWSNDGTTDIYVEGEPSASSILRLAFPMKDHGKLNFEDPNLAWVQNDQSRISLAFGGNSVSKEEINNLLTASSGIFEVNIKPIMLPLHLRIIVEDVDTLRKEAHEHPSYYGQIMANDVVNHPLLISVPHDVGLLESIEGDSPVSSLTALHMKKRARVN